jgi:glutamate dehydrogenase (NADP+)
MLHADGFRIVGVSDSRSAIYDPDGLDPNAVLDHKQKTGAVAGAPTTSRCKEMTNAELLQQSCDVLIPAALENQIIEENAGKIQARVVLELANGPTSPAADKVLNARKITVIPDILANAGGVTVSYFEWVQNKAGYYWTREEVQQRLKTFLTPEATAIWELSKDKGIDLRIAAYVHALDRIAKAIAAHGTKAFFRG